MNSQTDDLDWSGLPDGWDMVPLRSFVQGANNGVWGDPPSGGTDDVFCARVADFDRVRAVLDLSEPTVRSVSFGQRRNRLLDTGDLLLEKSGGGEKQPVGFVVLVEDLPGPTVCSNFVARMPVSEKADPRFVRYLHQCFYSMRVNTRHIKQTTGIQNLDSASYLRETAPRPPLPTQRAIAAFLDRETAKIDTLIEKKRRLLDLLDEKRTALITRAVTRGLDPDVPMKDSGVEWLGEIPEHWEARSIRSLARSGVDTFTDGDWIESPYIRDEGIRLIQTGNIGVGKYREQGFRYIDEATFGDFECTEVMPGDVLICRLAAPVGRACLAPDLGVRMITSVDVCILKPRADIYPEYVVYALSSSRYLSWMEAVARGSTRDRISRSDLGAIRIPMPPAKEQRRIADQLAERVAAFTDLAASHDHAISLLQEYRTALISAAVTGQIDVSEAAA